MPTITDYIDDRGKAVQLTDYSKPPPPVVINDVKHEYEPMKPEEAVRWALIFGALCGVGALVVTIGGAIARFTMTTSGVVQSSMFAGVVFPVPWIATVSVPVYILMNAYQKRIRYEDGMLRRFAPVPKTKQPKNDEPLLNDDENEEDDSEEDDDALTLYAQMSAILIYAHGNGGPAPVPTTERNGVASLPLVTGGTLDANGYAVPANQLQRYGLLTHGKNNIWQLAAKWQGKDLQVLGAELRRQVNTNG